MLIVGICASGRAVSRHRDLLVHAQAAVPAGWEFEILDNLADLPLFTAPVVEPAPAVVQDVRDRLALADILLISTPEYIHSLPASLKNLFEWTVASGEFYQKKVVVWTSSSMSTFVLDQVQEILRTMTAELIDEASGSFPLAETERVALIQERVRILVV